MATRKDYIAYLEDCLAHIPGIRFKAMFGEYVFYAEDVMVGLVCDQTMFLKITKGSTAVLGEGAKTAAPFQGAKDAFVLTEAQFGDKIFIAKAIAAARADLAVKKKRPTVR